MPGRPDSNTPPELFFAEVLARVPIMCFTPRMPSHTPLPVATKLLGLFIRGFWRRVAEWLPWWRSPQQTKDPVEEFLRSIFEVIAKVEEQVRNGTYEAPEEKARAPRRRDKKPPDKPPETSGRARPASPPPIEARPRWPSPPPAEPAEAQPADAAPPSAATLPVATHQRRQTRRQSPPPSRAAARPPPRPAIRRPNVKIAQPKPTPSRDLFVPLS